MTPFPPYNEQPTLAGWITFQAEHGKGLDEWLSEILATPDGPARALELDAFLVERAYCLSAFFRGLPLEAAKEGLLLAEVMEEFNARFAFAFTYEADGFEGMEWEGSTWNVPVPEIDGASPVTFGEFIDAKTLVQDARENERTRWELIRYLAAIFLRPAGEQYSEALISEAGDRLQLMDRLPLSGAIAVGRFFDRFNAFLEQHFAIFHAGPGKKAGRYTAAHFAVYGWINFLKSIAKTKIFDLPHLGLNSIECARLASCFDVLVYASEERAFQEAQAADLEAATAKK